MLYEVITACPLSAGTAPHTLEQAGTRLAMMQQKELTEDQIEKWYHRYSILELINNIPDERKSAVRWYIDCGDDDPLDMVWEGNCLIVITSYSIHYTKLYECHRPGDKQKC